MIMFYIGYFFYHDRELLPTGFIQYDNVSYIAYAKQYLDVSPLHLQYSNPFNDNEGHSAIYFQPQTILFALFLRIGVPPGSILIPFTLICSIICFYLVISIYDYLVTERKFRTLNIWFFAWGGGVLALCGIIAYYYLHIQSSFLNGVFILDPEHGWWGLNFGRSLFFTCEAYYHALFLGVIYSLLNNRWALAFALLFLLSLSHPFTGAELLCIVLTWCIVEFVFKRKTIPLSFSLGVVLLMCFHLYYYLIYLERFPDHHSVATQYALTWGLRYYRMIPAYCIVGALAIAGIYKASIRNFFNIKSNRLFICWFVIAFLLANHNVFITPKQPIHFTRGYIWTSLFLLGLPALLRLNDYLKRKFGTAAISLFALIFFSDNILWVFANGYSKPAHSSASYITSEQSEVLQLLNNESTSKTLIVSADTDISYLASIYTKAWPWYSHPYTTPFAEEKKTAQESFFKTGSINSAWLNREVNFVLRKTDTTAYSRLLNLPLEKITKTSNYIIIKYKPSENFNVQGGRQRK